MELFIVFLYKLKGKSEPERAEKDNKKLDFYLVYQIVININLNILEKKSKKIDIYSSDYRKDYQGRDLHECSDIVTFVFQDEQLNPVKSESQVYIDTSTLIDTDFVYAIAPIGISHGFDPSDMDMEGVQTTLSTTATSND